MNSLDLFDMELEVEGNPAILLDAQADAFRLRIALRLGFGKGSC